MHCGHPESKRRQEVLEDDDTLHQKKEVLQTDFVTAHAETEELVRLHHTVELGSKAFGCRMTSR